MPHRRLVLLAIVAVSLLIAPAAMFCAYAEPRVVSPFGATTGPEGYPRREGPHQGVDLAAPVGTRGIAPAEGVVNRIIKYDLCGNGVVVSHGTLATVYCHLSKVDVGAGQSVQRREVLGRTGTSGLKPDPGFELLHFEVRDGPTTGAKRLDPIAFIVGCFDASQGYAADRLVLTYPLPC